MFKSLSEVTIKDAVKGTVSAVFSTFNVVDSDGDVTLPGAIKDGAEVVISAYGHQSHTGALPVGKGVIRTTDTEAVLEGQFFLDTVAGKDTFSVVKQLGGLGEWSYSLNDVTSHKSVMDGREVNILENIGHIKEVSPVLMGAGIATRTLAAKGLKFSDEGEAVLAGLDAFVGRAQEVMVLRAAKGSGLSEESLDLLRQMRDRLSEVDALIDTKTAPAVEDHSIEDIRSLAVSWRRADLFSSLSNEGA